MTRRSAKFTAPEKEVEKKTVQLDQNTVNKRIAEFKGARLASQALAALGHTWGQERTVTVLELPT